MGNPLDRAANYFSKEEREQCALRYASGNQAVAREYLDRADGTLFYETVELNEAGNPCRTSQTSAARLSPRRSRKSEN